MEKREEIPEDIDRFCQQKAEELSKKSKWNKSGGFGIVYKVSFDSHRNVAMKLFHRNDKLSVKEAVAMFKHSHHENIVRFFGIVVSAIPVVPIEIAGLVMEFMPDGDLYTVTHNLTFSVSDVMKMHWIVQAGYALQYLHGKKIAHRDVKPQNMLLSDNYSTLKLCDFGLAKDYSKNVSTSVSGQGTFCYLPPERLSKEESQKMYRLNEVPGENPKDRQIRIALSGDIFGMSISIWEIMTRRHPFEHPVGSTTYSNYDVANMIFKDVRPCLDLLESNTDIREFLEKGWHGNHDERPKVDKLVSLFEKEKEKKEAQSSESHMSISEEVLYSKILLASEAFCSVLKSWDAAKYNVDEVFDKLKSPLLEADKVTLTKEEHQELQDFENIGEDLFILLSFKKYCKKMTEDVCTAKEIETIDSLNNEFIRIYGNMLHFVRKKITEIFPGRNPKTKVIELRIKKCFDETASFIEERKKNFSKISEFRESLQQLFDDAEKTNDCLEREDYKELSKLVVSVVEQVKKVDGQLEEDKRRLYMGYPGDDQQGLERVREVLELVDNKFKKLLERHSSVVTAILRRLHDTEAFYKAISAQNPLCENGIFLLAEEVARDHEDLNGQWEKAKKFADSLKAMGLEEFDTESASVSCGLDALYRLKRLLDYGVGELNNINNMENLQNYSLSHAHHRNSDIQTALKSIEDELRGRLHTDETIFSPEIPFSNQLKEILGVKKDKLSKEVSLILEINRQIAELLAFTRKSAE